MIEYLVLILAVPLGFILANITKDEKDIYTRSPYFPVLLWILAIASAVFYSINRQTALTLIFIFLMTLTWNRTANKA